MAVIDRFSGFVFSALLLAAVGLVPMTTFVPATDNAIAFFDKGTRITAGAYVAGLSAVALIWFVARLVERFTEAEGGSARLGVLALAGGIIAAGALIVAFMYLVTGAVRSGSAEGLHGANATAALDFSSVLVGNVMAIGFALILGSSALARSVLPQWLLWPTAVLAIGLLTPWQWAVSGLVLIWVPLVSWQMT